MRIQDLRKPIIFFFLSTVCVGCWESEKEVIRDNDSFNPWDDSKYLILTESDENEEPGQLLMWNGEDFTLYPDNSLRFAKQDTGMFSFIGPQQVILSSPEADSPKQYFYGEVDDDEFRLYVISSENTEKWFEKNISSLSELREQIQYALRSNAFENDATLTFFVESVDSTRAAQHRLVVDAFRQREIQEEEQKAADAARQARIQQYAARDSISVQPRPTQRQQRKIDLLDIGDGVYVQGFVSDELAYIVRIDKTDDTVKVRRASDGTTRWAKVPDIITREESQANDFARTIVGGAMIFCMLSPESCQEH